MKLTKEEKKLINARTPDQYIDYSIKLDIPRGRKAFLSRLWQVETGFSVEDIMYARNRHPYWKDKKQKNHKERTKKRLEQYDFSTGERIEWTDELIEKFLSLNQRKSNGRYVLEDRVLAERFATTIPGIQHMRRKYNYAVNILNFEKKNITHKRLMELMTQSEGILYRMLRDLRLGLKK